MAAQKKTAKKPAKPSKTSQGPAFTYDEPSSLEYHDHAFYPDGEDALKQFIDYLKWEKTFHAEQDRYYDRRSDAHKDRVFGLFEPMIPLLASFIVGHLEGGRPPGSEGSPDIAQLRAFFDSVKPEEFGKLLEMFGPRLYPIMDLAAKYHEGAAPPPASPPSPPFESPPGAGAWKEVPKPKRETGGKY